VPLTRLTWLGGFDPLSAATTTSPLDLDISVDGFQVLDLGTTAVATSGTGDIAIAFGANSAAIAEGGFGDYAIANTGATAIAGNPDAGYSGNDFDFASASGVGSYALAGVDPAHGGFSDAVGSSFDYASAISGNNTNPADGADAFAGINGSFDSASAIGQHVLADTGLGLEAPANFDGAFTLGNLTAPTTDLTAAIAGYGSSDYAFVFDPLGTVGSSAHAEGTFGLINNVDLAGVFGDMLLSVKAQLRSRRAAPPSARRAGAGSRFAGAGRSTARGCVPARPRSPASPYRRSGQGIRGRDRE
jgi:hypothetical protein